MPQLYPTIRGLMSRWTEMSHPCWNHSRELRQGHLASGLWWYYSSQLVFVSALDLEEGGQEDRALWLLHRRKLVVQGPHCWSETGFMFLHVRASMGQCNAHPVAMTTIGSLLPSCITWEMVKTKRGPQNWRFPRKAGKQPLLNANFMRH